MFFFNKCVFFWLVCFFLHAGWPTLHWIAFGCREPLEIGGAWIEGCPSLNLVTCREELGKCCAQRISMRWLKLWGRSRTQLQTWLFKNICIGEWQWNCNVTGLFCFQCNGLWAWRLVLSSLVSWDRKGQAQQQWKLRSMAAICAPGTDVTTQGLFWWAWFWERKARQWAHLQLPGYLEQRLRKRESNTWCKKHCLSFT